MSFTSYSKPLKHGEPDNAKRLSAAGGWFLSAKVLRAGAESLGPPAWFLMLRDSVNEREILALMLAAKGSYSGSPGYARGHTEDCIKGASHLTKSRLSYF